MTAPGHQYVQTPIAGLVDLALTAPAFVELAQRAVDRPDELTLVGPSSAQLYAACALARGGPLLVVTATGREADDLTAELRGDRSATRWRMFPSWETLPHERLSPGVDTVGRAADGAAPAGAPRRRPAAAPPLRVVVTTVRSLLQPMAPDLADIEPVVLRVGAEFDFDELVARLVELAYTRVDMVGKRGEFAVRGGILDIFPPTADHPVRVEFWGDEVTEMRTFSVADQRSLPEIDVDTVIAPPCRELLLTDEVRARAAAAAPPAQPGRRRVGGDARQARRRHPGRGHGGAAAGAAARRAAAAHRRPARGTHAVALRPGEGPHPRGRPGPDRAGVPRGVVDRPPSIGGDAPIDARACASAWSGRLDRRRSPIVARTRERRRARPPVVDVEPARRPTRPTVELDVRSARRARGRSPTTARRDLRDAARACHYRRARRRSSSPGTGTAQRGSSSGCARPTCRRRCSSPGAAPARGVVGVLVRPAARRHRACRRANLVVITETDLTGNRVTARGRGQAAGRQAAQPGRPAGADAPATWWCTTSTASAGSSRWSSAPSAARAASTWSSSTRSSKRGQPGDRLFVPMDSLDQLSRYVGGEVPAPVQARRLATGPIRKRKARKAVREIAGELVQLYAARQAAPGHAFGPDTPWQARDGGRVRVHRDRRPADRDRRGQGRHGEAGPDGPGHLR